jgi:hypothetical protein
VRPATRTTIDTRANDRLRVVVRTLARQAAREFFETQVTLRTQTIQ